MMNMTMVTSSSGKKYDPMYCLSEHLDYFQSQVASKIKFSGSDFDEIFGDGFIATPSASPALKKEEEERFAPPSPKSVISERVVQQQREASVASPTTVTSSVFTSQAPAPTQILPKVTVVAAAPVSPEVVPKPVAKSSPSSKAKATIRKRQYSQVESSTPTSDTTSEERPSSPVDREDVRRERNRQHAKRSRQRKREYTTQLEQSVQLLKEENARLFQMLGVDADAVHQREVQMEERQNESFIAALMQPENRVLSDSTLTSLRELFQN